MGPYSEPSEKSAYANSPRTLEAAESPPLTARIEAMLDEAFSILVDATGCLNQMHGRLFGFAPDPVSGSTTGVLKSMPEIFEQRVIDRLLTLLSEARRVRQQAFDLSGRI